MKSCNITSFEIDLFVSFLSNGGIPSSLDHAPFIHGKIRICKKVDKKNDKLRGLFWKNSKIIFKLLE